MSRVKLAETTPAGIITPPTGFVAIYARSTDKHIIIKDDTGFEQDITAIMAPVYGTQFQSAASEASEVTTLDTPVEKLKLTTSNLPAGTYKIEWNYEWSHNAGADDFIGQVELDDTDQLAFHRQEPKDVAGAGPGGTDQSHPVSGFAIRTLTAGIHTIDIDYYSSVAGVQSEIKNARLTIFRVS